MNVKTIKTNDMNKKGILTIVMIAMFAMPMEARADGFSWDAGTKTLTVTGTDIANNPASEDGQYFQRREEHGLIGLL